MSARQINVRKFLQYPALKLLEMLRGDIVVALDDGVYTTKAQDVVWSRYGWMFHEDYPDTPFLKSHLIGSHCSKGQPTKQSTIKMLDAILHDVYRTYEGRVDNPSQLMEDLLKRAYEISTNEMYSQLSVSLSEYYGTIDLLDMLDVVNDERQIEVLNTAPHTQEGVDMVYANTAKLFADPKYADNAMVAATNAGFIKKPQVWQMVGVRGFLTTADHRIFQHPIMRGFSQGINEIWYYGMEAQSAAKALASSDTALQLAEYFSRQLQHCTMGAVQRLHRGDCGSTRYLPWKVKDRVIRGGIVLAECDLVDLEGKYYLHEGELRMVQAGDKHLIGKTLMLRSPLAGCDHDDPAGICSTCYGEGAKIIPLSTNIGQHSTVQLMAPLVQKVISVKHYDGSASMVGIHLNDVQRVYLWAPENSNSYYINSRALNNPLFKLVIQQQQMLNITDLGLCDDPTQLDIERISLFSTVSFICADEDGIVDTVELDVELSGRLPSLSYSALAYIKNHHPVVDNNGNFIVDLKDWNPEDELLVLPRRHFNLSNLRELLESFLSGSQLIKTESDNEEDGTEEINRSLDRQGQASEFLDANVQTLITKFHSLTSAHLSVPLSALEVILLAHLTPEGRDYGIIKGNQTGRKVTINRLYQYNSLGASMAWERHMYTLTTPSQFLTEAKDRPDHPLDTALMTREVMQYSAEGKYSRYKCDWYCCKDKPQYKQ